MSFFKQPKTPPSSRPSEATAELMQRRAREYIRTLQQRFPRDFARLLSQVEQGDLAQAKLTLRSLTSILDEGYIEPVLQELQTQVASARISSQEALEAHPNALRILLRSGNRSEAIELYQKQTGGGWQEALDAIKLLEQKLDEEDAGVFKTE